MSRSGVIVASPFASREPLPASTAVVERERKMARDFLIGETRSVDHFLLVDKPWSSDDVMHGTVVHGEKLLCLKGRG